MKTVKTMQTQPIRTKIRPECVDVCGRLRSQPAQVTRGASGQASEGSTVKEHFQTFLSMLEDATSRIAADYFELPVHGADPMYRERVYCYELYHQLRCAFGNYPFGLGGEVDKAGHPHFDDGPYAGSKPDLLVHTPGKMHRNLAIVEVKRATVRRDDIGHDLGKLQWFCDNAAYFGGVFLVYGEVGESDVLERKIRDAAGQASIDLTDLACMYHRNVGKQARRIL